MGQAVILERPDDEIAPLEITPAPAAGLFGYSLAVGEGYVFRPMSGYIRDIEQMPNFSTPSMEAFTARFVDSNIGKTDSSS